MLDFSTRVLELKWHVSVVMDRWINGNRPMIQQLYMYSIFLIVYTFDNSVAKNSIKNWFDTTGCAQVCCFINTVQRSCDYRPCRLFRVMYGRGMAKKCSKTSSSFERRRPSIWLPLEYIQSRKAKRIGWRTSGLPYDTKIVEFKLSLRISWEMLARSIATKTYAEEITMPRSCS